MRLKTFKTKEDDHGFENNHFEKIKIIGGLSVVIVIVAVVAGFIYLKRGERFDQFSGKNEDLTEDLYKDADGDGVTDDLEEVYGTDKNKADSDGDGYSDFEEVNNGYNPLGDGKLNITKPESIGNKTTNLDKAKFPWLTFDDYCIYSRERKLAQIINDYRKTKGLSEIPLSKSLSYVARVHLIDLVENNPNKGSCNPHSWSKKGPWKGCCYPGPNECMTKKPEEIVNFKTTEAAENIHLYGYTYGNNDFILATPTAQGSLEGWIKSRKHHIVIINQDWAKDIKWKSLGVAIYKNWAAMWVADGEDQSGEPKNCTICNNSIKFENECYFEMSIDSNINYCDYIISQKLKDECLYKKEFYTCLENYGYKKDNFCFQEIKAKFNNFCSISFKDKNSQDECYISSATKKNDEALCVNINSNDKKDECYYYIALTKRNYSICSNIQGVKKKKNCEDLIRNNNYIIE